MHTHFDVLRTNNKIDENGKDKDFAMKDRTLTNNVKRTTSKTTTGTMGAPITVC